MHNTRNFALFIGDSISFGIGFLLFTITAFPSSQIHNQIALHAPSFTILVGLWIIVLFVFNFYDIQKSRPNVIFLRNFSFAGIVMLAVGFVFFYLNPITAIAPKTNLLLFIGFSLLIILGWRRLFYGITKSSIHTRCAIICEHPLGKNLSNTLTTNPELGIACIGIYNSLSHFSHSNPEVDLIIIDTRDRYQAQELSELLATHIEIIDITEAYERILYKIPVDLVTHDWIIHSIKKRTDQIYEIISRALGIIVATVIIIVTLPVTFITALLIKLTDKGPVFYHQTRTGLHNQSFEVYKFRSMIIDSEKNGAVWAGTHDNRITPIGKIIRKLHIDEIPQMWNIIRGDIGLVGPRAERPEFVTELEQQIPYYSMRHTIRPGFTGWAQIKFRYARSIADSQEKFEYDLYYIKNRNIFMDLGIIIKTVQIIFTHE